MARVSITVPFFRFLLMPGRGFVALMALGHALCLAARRSFFFLEQVMVLSISECAAASRLARGRGWS